jgi:hypothetical protein
MHRVVYGLRMVAKYGKTDKWLAMVYGLRMVAKYDKTDRWLARVVYGPSMVAKYGIRTDGWPEWCIPKALFHRPTYIHTNSLFSP